MLQGSTGLVRTSLGSGGLTLPRTGLVGLWKTSNGLIDSIGISARQRTISSAPITPVSPAAAGSLYYVNGTGAEYVGEHASYGIPTGNGVGTAANPFLTIALAYAGITGTNNTVYVAGGASGHIYTEMQLWTTTNKGAHWIADGDVEIAGDSTRIFLISKSSQILTGFTFSRSAGNLFWLTSNLAVTLYNCHIILTSSGNIRYESGGAYTGTTYNFYTCTFDVTISATATAYTLFDDSPSTSVFSGCTFNIASCKCFSRLTETSIARSHSLTIENSVINITGDRPNADADIFYSSAVAGGTNTLVFRYNNVVFSDIANVNELANFICLYGKIAGVDSVSANIYGNTFDAFAGNTTIRFVEAFNVSGTIDVYENTYRYKSDNAMGALFNSCEGMCKFRDNVIYGPVWYGNNNPQITHPVNFKGTPNFLFARNNVYGTCYGVVIKGTGNAGIKEFVSGGVFFNYFEDCTGPYIHPKGMSGVPIYNNTMVNTGTRNVTSANGGIYLGTNDPEFDNNPSPNCILKNNVVDFRDGSSQKCLRLDGADSYPASCDYNLWNMSNGSGALVSVGLTDYASIAAWQVSGFDAHSLEGDPLLSALGVLQSGSPCIGAGTPVFSDGAGDQYDIGGYMVWSDTFNAYVYHQLNGVDMGAYAYGGSDKAYHSLRVDNSWPPFLDLYDVIGLNNVIYNAAGTSATFATQALALAAHSSLADDTYLFGGTKSAALYSVDMSAKATQIKRYVGD
jgi:hypothetical protein